MPNSRANLTLLVVESDDQSPPNGPFVEPNNLEIDYIIDDFIKQSKKKGQLPINRHPCADKSHRSKGAISVMFLVKWKGLNYADATWECYEFVNAYWPHTIAHFQALQNFELPQPDPPITEFKEFTESPQFITTLPGSFAQLAKSSEKLKLFDFQVKGLNFLCKAWHQSRSVILGDQMGLGKTIQAIAFLRYLMLMTGVSGPFLIIAPLSTLQNFRSQLSRWLPFAYPVPFVGNRASRSLAKHFQFPEKGQATGFDILLTSYEVLRLEANSLRSIKWRALIVDEAHRLKNQTSKLFSALNDFNADFRLLLTGTPLQNTLLQLCSLLRFLDPPQFARLAVQNSQFAALQNMISKEGSLDKEEEQKQTKQLQIMKKILEQRMLRRRKQEVLALPPLEQEVVWLELSITQERWSKLVLLRNYELASHFQKRRNLRKISSLYVKLRHICNHPYLLSRSEQVPEQEETKDELQALIKASSKLEWLDQKLPQIREKREKVLIFTQTRLMLDLLEQFFELRGFPFLRLDGQTPSAQRQVLVDKFNSSPQQFAFLLSTRAGGLGLNISSASTVIIYESDFNPHNDLQALSRAHRLGQTSTVTVFRLLCKDSVEEGIFRMAKRKLQLQDLLNPPPPGSSSTAQQEQLNLQSSAKSAIKAVTHELAALFKSPSCSQKEVTEKEGTEKRSEEELKESSEEEKQGKTEEWMQNFTREYQKYKQCEAAEMGKGKRERKQRKSKYVSFDEQFYFSEDDDDGSQEDVHSDEEAFHLSGSDSCPILVQKQKERPPEPTTKVFEVERLPESQAQHERRVIQENTKLREQQKLAEERQEKQQKAKQLAQIQAAIRQTQQRQPPPLLRPTPVYGHVSSPPAPTPQNAGLSHLNQLQSRASFHSPRNEPNVRDHPLMSQLRRKASVLAMYSNKPFQEQRHIVGFAKRERLQFANLVVCFGFSHSLAEWKQIYQNIKQNSFLLDAYPLVKKKAENEFQVYALTFELLIEYLSKLGQSPFNISHFMFGPHRMSKILESQLQMCLFRSALSMFRSTDLRLLSHKNKFYEIHKFTPGWTSKHDIALTDTIQKIGLSHINKILHTHLFFLPGELYESTTQRLAPLILGAGYKEDFQVEDKQVQIVVVDALVTRLKTIMEFMTQL